MDMGVLSVHHVHVVPKKTRRVSDPLELELQM